MARLHPFTAAAVARVPRVAATHFSWRGTPDAMAAYRIQLGAHARRDLRA